MYIYIYIYSLHLIINVKVKGHVEEKQLSKTIRIEHFVVASAV